MEQKKSINIQEEIDIKYLAALLLRYKWLFAICLALAIAGGVAFLKYSTHYYKVSSSVIVSSDKNMATADVVEDLIGLGSEANVENEIEILHSRRIIGKALSNLDFGISYYGDGKIKNNELYKRTPIVFISDSVNEFAAQELSARITLLSNEDFRIDILDKDEQVLLSEKKAFGEFFKFGSINVMCNKTPRFAELSNEIEIANRIYLLKFYSDNDLINYYQEKLDIQVSSKNASVLSLSLIEAVPEKGKDFLQELMDSYMQYQIEQKNLLAENSIRFIDQQISLISDELYKIEQAILSYKSSKGITSLTSEAQMFAESLKDVNNDLAEVNMKLGFVTNLENYVKKNSTFENVSPASFGIEDPLLTSLIIKLSTLESEKLKYKGITKSDNPIVASINEQISYVKQSLLENIVSIKSSLEIYKKNITDNLTAQEARVKTLPEVEYQLVVLQRQRAIKEQLYNYLLQKKSENAILLASTVSDNKILDDAVSSKERVKPKTAVILFYSLVLGLLFPCVVVVLRESLNSRIKSVTDVENNANVPVIGIIPNNAGNNPHVLIEKPKSPVSEAFRLIRTNLRYINPDNDQKTYLITSTVGSEGKSFCASNIALSFSLLNKKTLLIGLDLRKPKLFGDFGYENNKGLTSYLAGSSNMEDVIVPSKKSEYLDIVFSGPIPVNPAELILSKRLEDFMAFAKENYEFVIIDTPPVGLVADAILLAKYCSACIYVVRENYSDKASLKLLNQLNEEKKFPGLSVLVNYATNKSGSYGGYQYGYGYGYGYKSDYYEFDKEETLLSKTGNSVRKLFKRKK